MSIYRAAFAVSLLAVVHLTYAGDSSNHRFDDASHASEPLPKSVSDSNPADLQTALVPPEPPPSSSYSAASDANSSKGCRRLPKVDQSLNSPSAAGLGSKANSSPSLHLSMQPKESTLGFSSPDLVRQVAFQPESISDPFIGSPSPAFQSPASGITSLGFKGAFGRTLADPRRTQRYSRQKLFGPSIDLVSGVEAKVLPVSFAGSLIGKSTSKSGVYSIKRSPVATDTRTRGKRVGQSSASGSYWVPARIDLDTMLNKIDARIIEDIMITKGPYSARYGPGFDHFDLQLLRTQRFDDGLHTFGSTSIDFETNNHHWYGRQSVWGGEDDWGFHVAYGHRTGNDYTSGNGTLIPASFDARDLYVALGYDLDEESQLEVNFIRLDETDVEFPGQAFDMDFLVTDGIEISYETANARHADLVTFDLWYNRTRFRGNAQSSGKRLQFPFLNELTYEGVTDVDSMSTGFRVASVWGNEGSTQLTLGTDLRYIKQELNEIANGRIGVNVASNANSPIPDSHRSNPGVFLDISEPVSDALDISLGMRIDTVSANVDDEEAKLTSLLGNRQANTFEQIVGTNQLDRDFALWALFAKAEYEINPCWLVQAGVGYSERPPNLTELYAAQPFMFLIQNGLNTVTGDPLLDQERLIQTDIAVQYTNGVWRAGLSGFYGWIRDYITFENIGMAQGQPFGQIEQVNLKYVNTDLATLSGGEFFAERDLNSCVTSFCNVSYVEGRDHSRNGDFATLAARNFVESEQVAGLPRGSYGGLGQSFVMDPGPAEEPLPGIPPLEARLGLRIHEASSEPAWSAELSARIVDAQDRVAGSLSEGTTPGFTVWDLRGYWQLNDSFLLMAGVENLTDKNYREHLDSRPIDPASPSLAVLQRGVSFYFGSEWTY